MDAERKARAVLGSETTRDESEHLQQLVAMLTQRLEAAERAIRDLSSEIASLSETVSGDRAAPEDVPPPVFRSAASRAAAGRPAPAPAQKPAAAPQQPPKPAVNGTADARRYAPGTRTPGTRHPLASEDPKASSGGRGWAIGASLVVLALAGAAGWWYGFGRDGQNETTIASGETDILGSPESETEPAETIAPTPSEVAPTGAAPEAIGPTPTPPTATPVAETPDETAAAPEESPPAAEPAAGTVTVDVASADDEASPDSLDDPEALAPAETDAAGAPATEADQPTVAAAPAGESDVALLPPPASGTTATAPAGAPAEPAAPALPDDASPEVVRLAELATQGNANAQHDLATAYALGNGVPRDYTTAAYWYRRAADAGMLNAIFNLGVLTDNGWGVERDPSQAFQLYLTAAEGGHPDAQNAVGLAYAQGYGTEVDPTKAASWFKAASTNGNPRGAFNLGKLYERGLNGTPDLAQAASWYQIAAEHGVAEARDALDRLSAAGTTPQPTGSDLVPADAPPPVATDGTTPADASTIAAALADKTELDPAGLKELQTLLAALGFDPGPADGMMGRRTRQAIDAFAAKIDVPSPNPPTRGLLEAARRAQAAQG
jgi:TPR repeat protein